MKNLDDCCGNISLIKLGSVRHTRWGVFMFQSNVERLQTERQYGERLGETLETLNLGRAKLYREYIILYCTLLYVYKVS